MLDGLLREWAAAVINEIESCSLPRETVIFKIMQNGCRVDTGVMPIPGYWPKPELVKLNDVICSLPVEDRNVIVMKRILGNSYSEIAKYLQLSKSGAAKRNMTIENRIWKAYRAT